MSYPVVDPANYLDRITIELTASEQALLLANEWCDHPGWKSIARKIREQQPGGGRRATELYDPDENLDGLEEVPDHRNDLGDWCPRSGERTADGTCPLYCHEADVLVGYDAGDRELPADTDLPRELWPPYMLRSEEEGESR